MATTRIMPLHIGKGRNVGTAVSDILEYVKDAEKTDQGRLVTCFQCNPEIADAEFCFSKRRYQTSTGRKQENDVIAFLSKKAPPSSIITATPIQVTSSTN